MSRRLACLVAGSFVLSASACGSSDNGTIQIITGEETTTFTETPAVTTLQIQAVDTSGNTTTLGSGSVSNTTIDLGSQNESTIATIEVSGLDAAGKAVVFGASVPVLFGGLAGLTQPVFVQRLNEFARLPNPLTDARQSPLLATVQGEYIFESGGSTASLATSMNIYDFLGYGPLTGLPSLPFAPVSVAFEGTVGWFFAIDGTADYFDLGDNISPNPGPITALSGGTFADIVGGTTVIGDGGVQYIVGATRTTGAPTASILQITPPTDTSSSTYPYGTPAWVTLNAARLGAAATWISGTGLVVVGGSAAAPGVEIVRTGATQATSLTGYAPDSSMGSGATGLTPATVLVAGGVTADGVAQGVRTIDLGCMASCAPAPSPAMLSVPLASAQAFTMSTTEAFVVGNELFTGTSHAYTVTATTATEVPTKVAHTNASAIWSPTGSIALVGGSSLIETFSF